MADSLVNDVGMLKGQVAALTTISGKLDIIIDKLVDQHDRHIAKVYSTMEDRRLETEADIKEIHDRIDMVLDKVQTTEKSILEKIEMLHTCINEHNKKEKEQLDKLLQWKWMIVGGVIAVTWLISHVNLDILGHLAK
jgi:ABC-type phosphate transport system ATPase subunit